MTLFVKHHFILPTKLKIIQMSFIAVANKMENGLFAVNGTASFFIDVIHKPIYTDMSGLSAHNITSFIEKHVNSQLPCVACSYSF